MKCWSKSGILDRVFVRLQLERRVRFNQGVCRCAFRRDGTEKNLNRWAGLWAAGLPNLIWFQTAMTFPLFLGQAHDASEVRKLLRCFSRQRSCCVRAGLVLAMDRANGRLISVSRSWLGRPEPDATPGRMFGTSMSGVTRSSACSGDPRASGACSRVVKSVMSAFRTSSFLHSSTMQYDSGNGPWANGF